MILMMTMIPVPILKVPVPVPILKVPVPVSVLLPLMMMGQVPVTWQELAVRQDRTTLVPGPILTVPAVAVTMRTFKNGERLDLVRMPALIIFPFPNNSQSDFFFLSNHSGPNLSISFSRKKMGSWEMG